MVGDDEASFDREILVDVCSLDAAALTFFLFDGRKRRSFLESSCFKASERQKSNNFVTFRMQLVFYKPGFREA